jgi:hypothetical protein
MSAPINSAEEEKIVRVVEKIVSREVSDDLRNGRMFVSSEKLRGELQAFLNEKLQEALGCAETFQFELEQMGFTTLIRCVYSSAVDGYVRRSNLLDKRVEPRAVAGALMMAELRALPELKLENGRCFCIPRQLLPVRHSLRTEDTEKTWVTKNELNEQLKRWYGIEGEGMWDFEIPHFSKWTEPEALKDQTLVMCLYSQEVERLSEVSGLF